MEQNLAHRFRQFRILKNAAPAVKENHPLVVSLLEAPFEDGESKYNFTPTDVRSGASP